MAGGKGGTRRGGVSRVVTTTGQGIQQWSLLSGTQEHITFEVFGKCVSYVQCAFTITVGTAISLVTAGEYGSQQFLLKTSSGAVKYMIIS